MKKNNSSGKRPLLITGPCSAESREQVLEIAQSVHQLDVTYFRAGIWKPRTRPFAFEGVGSLGLDWLKEVKQQYGMKTCVEVANVKHVYAALKAGMDMLWIGARTTTNPFSVQEIAEALRGVNIPVMVKNPINPDFKLWIGAFERLKAVGLDDLGGIHRGFSTYESKKYRNKPQWQIAIDFQNEFPEMPLICDPSHIGGDREYILELSQKAMDLNFDGLMIECHNDPDNALTDAKQQITTKSLENILNNLIIRSSHEGIWNREELNELRSQIDVLDEELIQLLSNRMNVAGQIGEYKKRNNTAILQNSRWQELLFRNMEKGEEQGMRGVFISRLFKLIHQESILVQESH